MRRFILAGFLLTLTHILSAQQYNKGKLYGYWGWNKAQYTNSDIRFKGDNYNFTLLDVIAKDRQSSLSIKYIDPTRMTIPQYNFRIGYFFHNKWNISIGSDHMKYVMKQNQVATIKGNIHTGEGFDGVYNNEPITLSEDFLQFEHTDGLNYANVELRRFEHLKHIPFKSGSNKGLDINATAGLGIGFLYPRTNSTLMGRDRNDVFHLSGYGTAGIVGLNFTFWERFFIQGELKGGYINMPDIRTTRSKRDKAQQDFFFLQENIVFGFTYPIVKVKR